MVIHQRALAVGGSVVPSLGDVREGCQEEMGLEPSKTNSSFASRHEEVETEGRSNRLQPGSTHGVRGPWLRV